MPKEIDHAQYLHSILQIIVRSTSHRSLFSMLVRSAPASTRDIEDTIRAGFQKELLATLDIWSQEQLFFYEDLIGHHYDHIKTSSEWRRLSASVVRDFIDRVHQRSMYFPDYSRSKNVAYSTAEAYLLHKGYLDRDIGSVTPSELLRHYAETGETFEGPCEMRQAFRFNDLKPRVYFAQGGTALFSSLYMKKIATSLLESLEATQMRKRQEPMDYMSQVSEKEDHIVLWDLSAFTSRLSEFKFFLWHLARYIQRDPLGNKKIRFFDYHQGVIQIRLWEYLDQYIEANAIAAQYTIDRFREYCTEDNPLIFSANGGLLGVPGNIGFSMFLHGMITTRYIGRHGVCIGDDAVASTRVPNAIIEPIQTLGDIAMDKFKILPPITDPLEIQVTKFTKRRVERTTRGLVTDFLLSFSPIPEILAIPSPSRTVHMKTLHDRQRRVIQDCSKALWDLRRLGLDATEVDLQLIGTYYRSLYRSFSLPFSGAFPRTVITPGMDDPVSLTIPSLDFTMYDPRLIDWAEFLWESRPEMYISLPMTVENPIKLPSGLQEGEVVFATYGGVLRFLEEMKAVEIRPQKERVWAHGVDNRRRFLNYIRGADKYYRLYRVQVVGRIPDIYYEWLLEVDHQFMLSRKLIEDEF